MSTLAFIPTEIRRDATTSFFAYDPYVETFWLPALGPTATCLLNELTSQSLASDATFTIEIADLSTRVGTGCREGSSSPVMKQLNRLVQAGAISHVDTHTYEIPKSIAPVSNRLLGKLSPVTNAHHEIWMSRLCENPLDTQRQRVSHLASHLLISGYLPSRVTHILCSSGLHPAIIGEALAKHGLTQSAA